ncbi:MAG: DUF4126 family protein [Candidatus Acidiferrales bacterium]
MTPIHVLLLALLIGFFAGLRSLTPAAVVTWAAHLGWMKFDRPLAWMASAVAVGFFTILALVELVTDKLPKTPARTAPPGLIARILLGALAGSAVAMAGAQAVMAGAALGIVGALIGTFGGYQARTRLVRALGMPGYVVAVLEDLLTIGGSLWVVSRF